MRTYEEKCRNTFSYLCVCEIRVNACYMEIHSRSVGTHSPMLFIENCGYF